LAGNIYPPDDAFHAWIDAKILRLNPDGSPDPTFEVTIRQNGQNHALAMAPTPDGKVLIGGSFTNSGIQSRRGIARLNADGSLDESFDPGLGVAGVLNQDPIPRVEVVALQPNGKAVIGGVFSRVNGVNRGGLARLNADGSLDTNFNASIDIGGLKAIIPLSDGRLLVAGDFTRINEVGRPNIARLNTTGALDTTFRSQVTGDVRSSSPEIFSG
jgi:uncharacterized delta-60 repeat protein